MIVYVPARVCPPKPKPYVPLLRTVWLPPGGGGSGTGLPPSKALVTVNAVPGVRPLNTQVTVELDDAGTVAGVQVPVGGPGIGVGVGDGRVLRRR